MTLAAVSPSVFAAMGDLTAANAGEQLMNEMRRWWSVVYLSDLARQEYLAGSGAVDATALPEGGYAGRHSGWLVICQDIVRELKRQVSVANERKGGHWDAASDLRAVPAGTDEGEAEEALAREREAAAHDRHADAALLWEDAANTAAGWGARMIADRDASAAGLVRAAGRAGLRGGAAERREYHG